MLQFTWDKTKASSNLLKHGVSFHEASTVFGDGRAIQFYDVEHSVQEDRFLMLGMSEKWRLLLVVHTVNELGFEIRIISARCATNSESRHYFEQ